MGTPLSSTSTGSSPGMPDKMFKLAVLGLARALGLLYTDRDIAVPAVR